MDRADGLERLLRTEWLLTTRSGSFAMGSALGVPTRRYHSMLNVALRPPVNRFNTLALIVDSLELGGHSYPLSGALFEGLDAPHPDAFEHLDAFEQDVDRVRWIYRVGSHTLTRTLALDDEGASTTLSWHLDPPADDARVVAMPLLAMRDIHALCDENLLDTIRTSPSTRGVVVRAHFGALDIQASDGRFTSVRDVWRNLRYPLDRERGFPHVEPLLAPATFTLDCGSDGCHLNARVLDNPTPSTASGRRARCAQMIESIDTDTLPENLREPVARLCCAADAFLVQRVSGTDHRTTVLAGYPWFADWGRDTMIALPGLMLATGRVDDAISTLTLFADHLRDGLVPNRFDDRTDEAHYNTADASLWFVHAVGQLNALASSIPHHLIEACEHIVEAHRTSSAPRIAMDNDGLLIVGDERTQLTWMDAQHDGHCFTPRHGKPVEINALWINALRTLASLDVLGDDVWSALADRATTSFRELYWLPERGWLADVLQWRDDGWVAIEEMRPNQILAASLPISPLRDEQRASVVRHVRERLVTPMGVRTLDPEAPRYARHYRGSPAQRDASYHMGTAWPWLMGPLVEAHLRVNGFSEAARAEALEMLRPLIESLSVGCLGQLDEVADGEPREDGIRHVGGCPAQAWSVAEVLRAVLLCTRKSR